MNVLSPLAGVILAAAVIPPLLLLYFLKLRRRTQPIASTLLWQRSVEDLSANAPFQRLRWSVLLLLQLLVLALLILAIMEPQVESGTSGGGRTVILIDTSASMAAADETDGRTRLQEALRQIEARIEARYGGGLFGGEGEGQTMIIAFNDRAEIICPFTGSKRQLLEALELVEQTHRESRIGDALRLARAYTRSDDPELRGRRIVDPPTLEVYTDGRIGDLEDNRLQTEKIIYYPMGSAEADNVALTAVSVERPFDRPSAVQVFASLRNYGATKVTCRIKLVVNGIDRSLEEVSIDAATVEEDGTFTPGEWIYVCTPFEQPRDAVIQVVNLRTDDLMADNSARVVVPPLKQLRVAVVEPKSFIIADALAGLSLGGFDELTGEELDELIEQGKTDQYDVIVFDDHEIESLPPGRYLTFGATPPVEALNPKGEGDDQLVIATMDEHPVMRFVNLADLQIINHRVHEPADEVLVLAEGGAGRPLIMDVSSEGVHVVHVAFDVQESNWFTKRSFVTFVFNAVEYLGHKGEAISREGFTPGEPITTRLPIGAGSITMKEPDGTVSSVNPLTPTSVSWGPSRLAGMYELSWQENGEPRSREFAVNLLSQDEGHLAPTDALAFGPQEVAATPRSSTGYLPLWPWAIAACLLLLMFEWWYYHRKAAV